MKDKRFIEESFPLKEVSTESAREKNIRHGHISTLHIWWARRPLASSRATSYAALIPAPKSVEEWNKKKQFIIELSKWENSLNLHLIEKAKRDILEANNGRPLKVLDPFAGGGAIPLEALRLGCETYAGEYNPVAVLILKCTLEYPQKYGKSKKINVKSGIIETEREINPLLEDVKKWGNWVLKEAKKENITCKIIEEYNVFELMNIYSNCDVLVGMRLHSIILALKVGTPCIGLFHENWGLKNPGLMEGH